MPLAQRDAGLCIGHQPVHAAALPRGEHGFVQQPMRFGAAIKNGEAPR
jgi:hypothetical protein